MTKSSSLRDSVSLWRFGAILCAGILLLSVGLRVLNAPPTSTELKVIDARLLEPPTLFAKGTRVRLRFAVEGIEYCGIVEDYRFIPSATGRAAILNLSTTAPIKVGVQSLSECGADSVHVWQVEQRGISFLTLAATGSAANAATERAIFIFLVQTMLASAGYIYAKRKIAVRAASNAA
jgi:hypothetical protein